MSKESNVWVIAGRKVGQRNSAIGVAQRVSPDYEYLKVKDILDAGGLSSYLTQEYGDNIRFPDLVISTGTGQGPEYAIELKDLSGGEVTALNINYPKRHLCHKFDIVASERAATFKLVKNPVWVTGVPHKITSAKLEEAEKEMGFLPKIIDKDKPLFLAMIGGDIDVKNGFVLTVEDAREAGKRIREVVQKAGGQLLATNSPRITVAAWRALKEEIEPVSTYIYDCREIHQKNPLMAMLGQKNLEAVIVTGDSISMCCEALAPSKPVYIIDTPSNKNEYYSLIHQELFETNHARSFEDLEQNGLDKNWEIPEPLDEAGKIANHVLNFLEKKNVIASRGVAPGVTGAISRT